MQARFSPSFPLQARSFPLPRIPRLPHSSLCARVPLGRQTFGSCPKVQQERHFPHGQRPWEQETKPPRPEPFPEDFNPFLQRPGENPFLQRREGPERHTNLPPGWQRVAVFNSSKTSPQYVRFGNGRGSRGSGWTRGKVIAVGAGSFAVVYYVTHLEQVPETGRWRFMDVSADAEKQMGQQALQETLQEYRGRILPRTHATARYVERIAMRIVQQNGLDRDGVSQWECHVVHAPDIQNAFVLPGGKIFVFTGLLPVAQDADGLAVVLGHEIAHQVARHSAERMSSMKVLMVASLVLQSMGLDFGLTSVLLNLVMTLPNSRKNEKEADYIGLILANKACFDPQAAAGLWKRMAQLDHGGRIDFLSTHPASEKRVDNVTEWSREIIRKRPDQCGPLKGQMEAFSGFTTRPGSYF